ncbi:WD-40 repeat-containing protein-like protein [Plenodomus tracheiphilus IPT5]|uniref:methylated diphthine methylhydrolase n=1 Tax=Plenodomus tracheiphilus IPT5 TaxID=1408161 RepID=A0A6A7BB39_9PLEO|nr:WD-40 repeat-containing protein-like protein [Plenodomus tracheiphilus IPT5]
MSSIKSLTSFRLDLPPSCIEFFPLNPQYAVIGTYNLEKQEEAESAGSGPHDGHVKNVKGQKRNGSLVLVRVIGDNVDIIQSLPTPSAILDLHFLTQVPSSNFGVATSTGAFAIYELKSWERNPAISHIKTIQYFPEDVLITAFSWHPESYMVGMTLSNNEVHLGIIDTGDDSEPPSTMEIARHDLEAWTLAFLSDGSGILSGGDDSTLRFAELTEGTETSVPWSDKKVHGAGVTAILPVHLDDEGALIITGSYDDHIRLLHVSKAGRRSVLAETNLGGGVWRLKLLDRNPKLPAHHGVEKWRSEPPPEAILILVSCMHAGARIIRLIKSGEGEKWVFEVLANFMEHESMNYGSDSQPNLNGAGERTFISTSFYDRRLCLWRY